MLIDIILKLVILTIIGLGCLTTAYDQFKNKINLFRARLTVPNAATNWYASLNRFSNHRSGAASSIYQPGRNGQGGNGQGGNGQGGT